MTASPTQATVFVLHAFSRLTFKYQRAIYNKARARDIARERSRVLQRGAAGSAGKGGGAAAVGTGREAAAKAPTSIVDFDPEPYLAQVRRNMLEDLSTLLESWVATSLSVERGTARSRSDVLISGAVQYVIGRRARAPVHRPGILTTQRAGLCGRWSPATPCPFRTCCTLACTEPEPCAGS